MRSSGDKGRKYKCEMSDKLLSGSLGGKRSKGRLSRISAKEATEGNLVIRILEGISGGYYPNAWFLYEKLPKAFKARFSYWDVIRFFHELEWNVKVIEIDQVYGSTAYSPWRTLGFQLPKKVVKYLIRPEFEQWKYRPGLLDAILENLHIDSPSIELDPSST